VPILIGRNSLRDRADYCGGHVGESSLKILELAKNADSLFVLQDSHEQARLLKMLVSNSTFDRGSLSVIYVKPFDLLVDGNESGNWLADRDSKPERRRQARASP
jgi:hypothetical protein